MKPSVSGGRRLAAVPPRLCRLYREQGAMFVKIHGVWLCPGFTSFPSLDKVQKTGQQHSDTLKVMKICRGFYYINRSRSTKKAFSNQIPAYSEAKRILSFHFGPIPVWMMSIKVIIGMGREGLWILTYYYSYFCRSREWLIKSRLQTQIAFEINTSLVMYFLSEKEKIACSLQED